MHILLLTLVFRPDGVSTAELMGELALDLQAAGHRVTVLTTTPHYNLDPESVARQPLERAWPGLLCRSDFHGIEVLHAVVSAKGGRTFRRILDYLRFHAVTLAAAMARVRAVDLVFSPSPPLTSGLFAWLLALRYRVPFIYNVQEIYPDIAVEMGLLRNRGLVGILRLMERFIYRKARKVVVICDQFRRVLLEKGVAAEKVVSIPNFVDAEFVQPLPRDNAFSRQYGLNESFVVSYAGNVGLTQCFEQVLDAAERLAGYPAVRFVIVGDGGRRRWLEEQIRLRDLRSVCLIPYQPRSSIPQIYASSDLCLVPMKSGLTRSTFPSKIFTIMAAARPVAVIADPDSELVRLTGEAGCGWVAAPGDAAGLAGIVEHALNHPGESSERGRRGREHIQRHYSRQSITSRYLELFQRVTGKGLEGLREIPQDPRADEPELKKSSHGGTESTEKD